MNSNRIWQIEAYNTQGKVITIYQCMECEFQWTDDNKEIDSCPQCSFIQEDYDV
jgi:rubrerythrin